MLAGGEQLTARPSNLNRIVPGDVLAGVTCWHTDVCLRKFASAAGFGSVRAAVWLALAAGDCARKLSFAGGAIWLALAAVACARSDCRHVCLMYGWAGLSAGIVHERCLSHDARSGRLWPPVLGQAIGRRPPLRQAIGRRYGRASAAGKIPCISGRL